MEYPTHGDKSNLRVVPTVRNWSTTTTALNTPRERETTRKLDLRDTLFSMFEREFGC